MYLGTVQKASCLVVTAETCSNVQVEVSSLAVQTGSKTDGLDSWFYSVVVLKIKVGEQTALMNKLLSVLLIGTGLHTCVYSYFSRLFGTSWHHSLIASRDNNGAKLPHSQCSECTTKFTNMHTSQVSHCYTDL